MTQTKMNNNLVSTPNEAEYEAEYEALEAKHNEMYFEFRKEYKYQPEEYEIEIQYPGNDWIDYYQTPQEYSLCYGMKLERLIKAWGHDANALRAKYGYYNREGRLQYCHYSFKKIK